MTHSHTLRQGVYARITNTIIADLEQGVRPWMKPLNAGHAAGRITRPQQRHIGQPYNGINILMHWSACIERGYAAPICETYRQAKALGAQARKREKDELVVYAKTLAHTELVEKMAKTLNKPFPK